MSNGIQTCKKKEQQKLLMRLRIATYNIHRCVGRDGIEDPERINAVLREIDADIVALQEVTSHPEKRFDILGYLSGQTGMQAIKGITLTLEETPYGNAFLSRLPITSVKRIDISVTGKEPRGVVELTLSISGRSVFFWATHLGLGARERQHQIKKLLQRVDEVEANTAVLLGDCNEWFPWNQRLVSLGKRFSSVASPATFPSWGPFLKLDRIWARPAGTITHLRTHKTKLSRIASDHLPLVADIIV